MDGVVRCFPLAVVCTADVVHYSVILLRLAVGHADAGRAEHEDIFHVVLGFGNPGVCFGANRAKAQAGFCGTIGSVAEDGTSESNLSNVSHDVFEDEEMEFVPEAPEFHRLISTEEEMYAEWPKLVTLVLSLRIQLVAFAIKANSDAGEADLLSGLDYKLAILKGLIGASPHSDSVVAELGVDVFSVLDGLAGTVYKSRSLVNQSLKEMEIHLATSATRVEELPVRIEKVEATLTQGGEVFRALSTLATRLGK